MSRPFEKTPSVSEIFWLREIGNRGGVYGCGVRSLRIAAANRSAGLARWLIGKGSDAILADKKGRTPLRIAPDDKDTNVMSLLLNIGGADARHALPGHDDEQKAFKTTSDLIAFLIKTAEPTKN